MNTSGVTYCNNWPSHLWHYPKILSSLFFINITFQCSFRALGGNIGRIVMKFRRWKQHTILNWNFSRARHVWKIASTSHLLASAWAGSPSIKEESQIIRINASIVKCGLYKNIRILVLLIIRAVVPDSDDIIHISKGDLNCTGIKLSLSLRNRSSCGSSKLRGFGQDVAHMARQNPNAEQLPNCM
jgi:hypothetical protein